MTHSPVIMHTVATHLSTVNRGAGGQESVNQDLGAALIARNCIQQNLWWFYKHSPFMYVDNFMSAVPPKCTGIWRSESRELLCFGSWGKHPPIHHASCGQQPLLQLFPGSEWVSGLLSGADHCRRCGELIVYVGNYQNTFRFTWLETVSKHK